MIGNRKIMSGKSEELFKHVRDLTALSGAMLELSKEAPTRLSVAQMTFFLIAAAADLRGNPAAFGDIKEQFAPKMARTLHSTYRTFLVNGHPREPTLGWLDREYDPLDSRRKFLRLTAKGRNVVRLALSSLTGKVA